MNKNTIILFAIILGLAVFSVIYDLNQKPKMIKSVPTMDASTKAISSNMAPDISFKTINGDYLSLSDFHGKVVMLNFWASWCSPCVKEFPAMLNLMKEFDGKLVFLAVSKDVKKIDIERFLKRMEKTHETEVNSNFFQVVWDKDKLISEKTFNTLRVPETIIIDPQGNMVRKILGASPLWETQEIRDYFKGLF